MPSGKPCRPMPASSSMNVGVARRCCVLVTAASFVPLGPSNVHRSRCNQTAMDKALEQAQRIIEAWRRDYNHHRPHGSLGKLTPSEYVKSDQVRLAGRNKIPMDQPLGFFSFRGSRTIDITDDHMTDKKRENENAI